ncbi:preprotein translocase subunit YajC [Weissella paramesenteroides]|jgi:preprotein translocase subunit YajC|uniref:Preprotein translocase, YajC subunit n=2 Tax=Weissella paramesenteroides TaxID=1249 RepID=C5RD21_WEIPA|nr:preprotein translocase subunit YajC [Weissella paramesenteroides]ATF41009.1 preprotein translocase subunit YajC [Weissella paramesenteroides]EER73939.1 preprotein translocase, YajC subunit [Weissella paramesenteroides ATCC 33313]KAA8440004.1 preprotein translocase subunit YajC [Weissella paramesenteroides]KAA8440567.1 preprotein translocase subunit YajC [Weissella paramesenteroides]KAA8443498.1 preprotein translocase subunit YajC [Weissella paramesenteroides]
MNANILILVVFIAAMYFIMIRPQQKAQKKRQAMINDVQPGAEVITIGGLHGTIAAVNKEARTFDLDAEGVILVFELSAIRQVVKEANAPVTTEELTETPETSESEATSEKQPENTDVDASNDESKSEEK